MYLNLYKCIQQIMGTVDRTSIQQFKHLFVFLGRSTRRASSFLASFLCLCYPAKDQAWEKDKTPSTRLIPRKSFRTGLNTLQFFISNKEIVGSFQGLPPKVERYSATKKQRCWQGTFQSIDASESFHLLRRKLPERTTSRARLQRTHQMPYC